MKRLIALLMTTFLCGCGATVDRHVVTLSDVDTQLASDYGSDLRWYDLADERDGFDRDMVSRPGATTTWTSLCSVDCTYAEQHYSAVFEDIAHVAFLVEQIGTLRERDNPMQFRRLARFGARYVNAERLRTLRRRLDTLRPEVDFADRPELRRASELARQQAAEQLEIARRRAPVATKLVAQIVPPVEVVEPFEVRPVTRAWATALRASN